MQPLEACAPGLGTLVQSGQCKEANPNAGHRERVAAAGADGYDRTSRSDAVEDGLLGLAGLVILLALAGFGLQELAVELRNAQEHPSAE